VCILLQALGETGTVLSEDGDCDVRVEVSDHVWTFNPACCTRLAPVTKMADIKHRSDHGSETSSDGGDDDDDDDDDEDEQETIRMSYVLLSECYTVVC